MAHLTSDRSTYKLTGVYCFGSDEMIRDLMEELLGTKMTTSQDTDKYFLRAKQLRSDVSAPKKPVRY